MRVGRMARVLPEKSQHGCNLHRGDRLYRSLAVPLDGTQEAESAVAWGESIASRSDASLHVLLMAREGASVTHGEQLRAATVPSGYVEAVTARVGVRSGVRVHGAVLRGDAGVEQALRQLQRYVRDHRLDLLVATRGAGGCGGEPMTRLCEQVPIPVLVVPAGSLDAARMRNMLVVLDGTKPAERIIPFVAALAELFDGHVTLLTVLAPSYVIGASGRGAAVDCAVEPKRHAARGYLDGVARRLRRQGCTAESRVLVRAREAQAIVDCAISEGVGLLAAASACDERAVLVPEVLHLLESVPVAMLTYCPPGSRVSPRRPEEA